MTYHFPLGSILGLGSHLSELPKIWKQTPAGDGLQQRTLKPMTAWAHSQLLKLACRILAGKGVF